MVSVSVPAWGQRNPSGDTLIDGSVAQQAMATAAQRNGQIFGAAGFLDRVLEPTMQLHLGDSVLAAESSILQGMIRAPANLQGACSSDSGGTCPYGYLDIDAFSSAGGVGWQGENASLFYVASWTAMRLTEAGTEVTYPMLAIALAGLGFFNLYTAPLYTGPTKVMDGLASLFELSTEDYIVGAGYRVSWLGMSLGGRVGFLGSNQGSGAYLRLDEGVTRLMASAVLRTESREIPYAMVGMQHSAWLASVVGLGPSETHERLPLTLSLYGQSLRLEPMAPPPDAVASHSSLWTAHAGIESLAVGDLGYLEAAAAIGIKPTPFLHEVRGSFLFGNTTSGVLASVAYVGMPAMPYYGTRGGGSLGYRLEFVAGGLRLALRRNDSDILMRYPFAQGETQIYIGYSSDGGDAS